MKRSWDNKRVIAFFAGNDRAGGGVAGKLGVERALFLDNWGVVRALYGWCLGEGTFHFSVYGKVVGSRRYWLTPILFSGYVNLIKAMQYLFQMLLFRIVGLFNLKSFTNSIGVSKKEKASPSFCQYRKNIPIIEAARIYCVSREEFNSG